nr:hypothetical protein [uncultured archaeon]
MAKSILNITTSKIPATDSTFAEQAVNSHSGPTPVLPPNVSLESKAIQPVSSKNAAIWNHMTAFDDGLKAALIEFIDTTMEGVKYNKSFSGRAKIIDFFFYGTSTKSVKPSEIGHFKLEFKYPPNIINQSTSINNIIS